ncbi:MAG: tRNA lysidine(34) synthetase TilS [Bacteroidetes bacterium]|nr:tRNA lysidine(34) synthetase TilS [Bacteroidota bacterium]
METEFFQQFKTFITKNKLVSFNDKILLAVSGGADSVVMVHLFKKLEYSISIAHVNFRLRGDESDEDERFVRELAQQLNIPVHVKMVATKAYAAQHHLSTQVAARDLRYAYFDELCQENGYTRVALGHHLDDQVETFFINLMRRSGLKGLGGMPLTRNKFIRPLLFARRSEIEQYARHQGIAFRNDSSNDEDHYVRNKIRHHLVPPLESNLPGFSEALASGMNLLKEDAELIQQVVAEKKQSFFAIKGEEIHLPVSELKKLHPLHTWLYYLLSEFDFNPQVLHSATEAILNSESGKLFGSHTHRMVVDRSEVIIVPLAQNQVAQANWIDVDQTEVQFPVHLLLEVIENSPQLTLKVSGNMALFDRDKLHFPLLLRPWQQGDRFVPFGMKGSKLVSDFLIDQKISVVDKAHVFVLVSGDEIIWVVGHRAGGHASVTNTTRLVLNACQV